MMSHDARVNQSWQAWTSHGKQRQTDNEEEKVRNGKNERQLIRSHGTCERVIAHMNESWHI